MELVKLKNLKMDEGEITESAAVNLVTAPKIRIDRRTGRISINGRNGDYVRECDAYSPSDTPRKF